MGLNCFTTRSQVAPKKSNLKGCRKKSKKDKLKESVIQNNSHHTGHYSPSQKRFGRVEGPVDGSLYTTVDKSNSDLNASLNKPNIYTNLNATSIDSGISSSLGEQSTGKSIYSSTKQSPETRSQRLKLRELDTSSNQSFKSSLKSSAKSSFKSRAKECDYLDRLDIELIKLIEQLDSEKKSSMPKTADETELDDLLSDMLLDLQSTDSQQTTKERSKSVQNNENQNPNIQTADEQMLSSNQSRHLTGGGRMPANLADDEQQTASPRFLKKPASTESSNLPSIAQPFSYGLSTTSPALQRRRLHSEKTAYVCESEPNEAKSKEDRRSEENLIEILKQQANDDSKTTGRELSMNSSIVSDSSAIAGEEDVSWLERQKMKLKSRKEGDMWRDRYDKERSLMQELRTAVKPKQQEYDQPLHIDTNQSINIPVNRTDSPFDRNYQRSQSANTYQAPNDQPDFRTVHTKKKTLQRGGSTTRIRSQSPSQTSVNIAKEPIHATNLPIGEEIIEECKPQQSVYGTISRTPVVHNIKIDRTNIPVRKTVDESDLNELIRTASSPIYSHSRPTSRQSNATTTDGHQPVYRAQTNQVYAGYNQSSPIRCIADLPDCNNPELPNPRWSPISGSYLKKNYPNERATTPLFPISTPTRSSEIQSKFTFDNNGSEVNNNTLKNDYNSSQVSSPSAMSTSERVVLPETYLKIKRQQEEQARLVSSHSSNHPTNHPNHTSNHQTNHLSNQLSNQQSPNPPITNNKLNQSFEFTNLDEDQSTYLNQSERSSLVSLDDVIHTNSKFIQDSSQYWYRPTISRDEAIRILLNRPPGSFIVRDSESFRGAFGLAIRVSQEVAEQQKKSYGKGQTDLVRHFLIEPTTKGVRIKGCANEPIFGSLSALIYQHTTTQLALPCKLVLPEIQPLQTLSLREPSLASQLHHQQIMQSGAACNAYYLITIDTESLTGPEAIKRAVCEFLRQFNKKLGIKIEEPVEDLIKRNGSTRQSKKKKQIAKINSRFEEVFDDFKQPAAQQIDPLINGVVVYFKVSSKGISLTDNTHRHFFRKHFTIQSISYCGLDSENRKFQPYGSSDQCNFFGFVTRPPGNSIASNQTHLFADSEPHHQPASVIVSFINRVMISVSSNKNKQY